jgi:hypothetical protein
MKKKLPENLYDIEGAAKKLKVDETKIKFLLRRRLLKKVKVGNKCYIEITLKVP